MPISHERATQLGEETRRILAVRHYIYPEGDVVVCAVLDRSPEQRMIRPFAHAFAR